MAVKEKRRGFRSDGGLAVEGNSVKLKLVLVFCLTLVFSICGCGTSGAAPTATSAASTTSSHKVVLIWDASTSPVAGYNVYRFSAQGNSYVLLNAQPVTGLTYTDSNVQSGKTYYYAVTAVDANGVQSVLSNQVAAVVPNP